MTKPLLHFAHANGFPAGSYRQLLNALGAHYQVFAIDKLGHDPRYPVDNNWRNPVRELRDFLRAQAQGPVIGVGHSFGGVVTFRCAHQYPELFRAVIMLDPPMVNGVGAGMFMLAKGLGLVDRITPAGRSKGRREEWPSRQEAGQQLRPKALFRAFDEACFQDYLDAGLEDTEAGVRLAYRNAVELAVFRNGPHDSWRYRTPLPVPGALVTATQGSVVAPPVVRSLVRQHRLLNRQAKGSHMFPLEHPAATAELVHQLIHELKVGV